MPTSSDAAYRVFIHNPPSESKAGSPAFRYQHGPQRAGVMEWRTNDYDRAVLKAQRIVNGEDKDNSDKLRPGGWVTIDANKIDEWMAIRVFRKAGE